MSRRDHLDTEPCSFNWNALHHAFFHMSRGKLLKGKIDCGSNEHNVCFTGRYEIIHGELWMTLTPETRVCDKKGKLKEVTPYTNLRRSRRAWADVDVDSFLKGSESESAESEKEGVVAA